MIRLSADELRGFVRGIIKENEPMSLHTTYGIGGPADVYVEPADEEDLATLFKWVNENKIPHLILGGGANLLVSDAGVRGIVIQLGRPFSTWKIEGERLTAGAGALLVKVIDASVQAGLKGLEVATGVPGTVGGAVIMNAGTHRGWVGDVIENVRVIRSDGSFQLLAKEDLDFSYKHSALQGDATRIITKVTFKLEPGDKEHLVRTVQMLKRRRNDSQPTVGKSCGCVFKNPEGGSAGLLIDEARLKGKRRGDAVISDVHANFILNMGNATASDIRSLAEEVRDIVQEKHGVKLEYEVRIVGDWTDFEEA